MSTSPANPRWLPALLGTPGLIVAVLWGFAEGTLFFIVPDLILTLTALFSIKRACLLAVSVTVGSLIAGWLMFAWSAHEPASAAQTVACVPLVKAEMTNTVRASYHLFEDINYIELIDLDRESGMGTLVGTNLHNYAMPMIRYVQNDLGSIHPTHCNCGWQFRELSNLQGRKNDSFIMPSGKEISSGFLLDATYSILLTWRTAVNDFCLIQYAPDRIVLQIIPGAICLQVSDYQRLASVLCPPDF